MAGAARVLVAWDRVVDGRQLATGLAIELLGRHPGPLHHSCPTCGSIEHGRPSFDAPIAVSLAHAGDLTAVAVTTAGDVGIDAEAGDGHADWVRTEAVAKAYGVGIVAPPPDMHLPVRVSSVEIPGLTTALALLGAARVPVELRPPGTPAAPDGPATR